MNNEATTETSNTNEGKNMTCHTPASMRFVSQKRQAAIDAVRKLTDLRTDLEENCVDIDVCDFDNVINELIATLPKADQDELRHG